MTMKNDLKSDSCTFFLIYLVGMVISTKISYAEYQRIMIIAKIVLKTKYVL